MGAAVLKIRHLYIGEQLHSDSTSLNSVNINAYPLPIQNIVLILSCKTKNSPGGGMVDALVSGASAARRAGSSPVLGTTKAT